MTINTQSLTQAELDDIYHKAVFDCDQALADVIRRMFLALHEQMVAKGVGPAFWNAFRDDHNEIAQAFNDCEVKHLGATRYDAMMARLGSSDKLEKSPQ
ncbi:hypothetical protein [Mesorhizobium sp.]|uniref:hypothetical protein n=1 Tax=Mesorhizobium sp. TaxID=1871066 RepID=UPI000FEAA151|nr:hypothetical protein [Mesorhizobium sp.]RWB29613.1 MAG: hypothetical protein EOQ41_15990 [Mesorhizobium sp.]RWE96450.1 MAG: hypothetical protein EOS43_22370 [Mesorhizobium sp.]